MLNLKTIAIYLPQFHRVKENDEWWGEGYTEWTAVQQAERYYDGHYQPRVPLNGNYYDLLNKSTMQWQAQLAQKYGIYGFSFYHYWFKDGRKILEKPAENLLEWSDIPINYCFSWASASWTRTWSNVAGGSMASKFEKYNELEDPVLLLQDYGKKKEWKEHFEYLLPFFRDDRYIKVDGRPVFIFHSPEQIECLNEMVLCWRELAKNNGFSDIYLIGKIDNAYREYPILDAIYAHEPAISFIDYIVYSDLSKKGFSSRYNLYEEISQWSLLRQYNQKQKMYYGTYVGFDSTPRHGKRGIIIDKITPDKFEDSFRNICQKSIASQNEFVFINAWNEWAEGNYLEPDEKYGFNYLEAVHKVLAEEQTLKVKDSDEEKINICFQVIRERMKEKEKFKLFFELLNQWLILMEEGTDIALFFKKRNYSEIAIYGWGYIGRHLVRQLKDKVVIKYFVDEKVEKNTFDIPTCKIDGDLPEVDVVVVTAVHEYGDVVALLKDKINCDIVSINEVLRECM